MTTLDYELLKDYLKEGRFGEGLRQIIDSALTVALMPEVEKYKTFLREDLKELDEALDKIVNKLKSKPEKLKRILRELEDVLNYYQERYREIEKEYRKKLELYREVINFLNKKIEQIREIVKLPA